MLTDDGVLVGSLLLETRPDGSVAKLELATAAGIQRFGSLQFSVDAHTALVDAIERGEPEVARRILSDLMNRHHEFVLGLYALAPDEVVGA